MRRHALTLLSLALLGLAAALAASGASRSFPETIALPNGWRPEGIAVGRGTTFFVGSIGTGDIWRGDLRTGTGARLVDAPSGRSAIGVDVDQRDRLFVAGGMTGQAYVYDARTGAEIAAFQLTSAPTFINDVIVTRTAAWFTDSPKAVLHRIPIAPDGTLGAPQTVPLTGDFALAPETNANGIDATPDGKTLVIVQSNTGRLFTVDPATGSTRLIDLGGESVPRGDGILLDGKTLYVVQNRLNLVAVVELAPDLSSGTVVRRMTDEDFDVPTTIDEHGDRLYAVNARFGTPPEPSTTYQVVQLRK